MDDAEKRPEVEECEECGETILDYYFPRYRQIGEECVGECPGENELDELYPDGWLII